MSSTDLHPSRKRLHRSASFGFLEFLASPNCGRMHPRFHSVLALTLLCGLFGLCGHSQAATRPNILFIMSDDHAAHAVSSYGSKVNQTPHIDRLAREGVRFVNAFVC